MRTPVVFVALAGALMFALSGCGSDEQAVFTFADDELCEWVSAEEVAEFVAEEFDWDGTAVGVEHAGQVGCQWELTGGLGDADADNSEVTVRAEDAGQWEDFDGNPYDIPEEEVVEYEDGFVGIGAVVVGHPAVSDGVVVHNGGFGQFAFGVSPDGEWLAVSAYIEPIEWDHEYEAKYFAVADHLLEELGWLSE